MTRASLSFWSDRLVWTSESHIGGETSRPYIAVLVGAWGELQVLHDQQLHCGRVVVVGPSVKRSIAAQNGFYSLNLDPIHPLCRSLRASLLSESDVVVKPDVSADMLGQVGRIVSDPAGCLEAWNVSQSVLGEVFAGVPERAVDDRVLQASQWLRREVPNKSYVEQLSALCGLSSGRLTHIFTEQMGVSLKSYLLAMKMRRAAECFTRNRTLTEIAHDMGFSDSAHLTRAFQAHFSVPPSLVADACRVQLTVCEQLSR